MSYSAINRSIEKDVHGMSINLYTPEEKLFSYKYLLRTYVPIVLFLHFVYPEINVMIVGCSYWLLFSSIIFKVNGPRYDTVETNF